MYIASDTVDDMLRRVIRKLLKCKTQVRTSRGKTREIFGVLLQINNPRARLSLTEKKGTLFSCLGELLWYLAKSDELAFINYYAPEYRSNSDDNQTIRGAYGPRLYDMKGHNQITNVLNLLRKKRQSRRAVIQLFEAGDIENHYKEIPCTCTLQFAIRSGRLDMLTSMRSNDAFLGLPHDVFAFTMFQELMARALKVTMGTYRHVVGSIHLYEKNIDAARAYLKEGWQSNVPMPRMPVGDPWPAIKIVSEAERELRNNHAIEVKNLGLAPYWEDLVRLLEIYQHFKNDQRDKIGPLKKLMRSRIYDPYIEKKILTAPRRTEELPKPLQLSWL